MSAISVFLSQILHGIPTSGGYFPCIIKCKMFLYPLKTTKLSLTSEREYIWNVTCYVFFFFLIPIFYTFFPQEYFRGVPSAIMDAKYFWIIKTVIFHCLRTCFIFAPTESMQIQVGTSMLLCFKRRLACVRLPFVVP